MEFLLGKKKRGSKSKTDGDTLTVAKKSALLKEKYHCHCNNATIITVSFSNGVTISCEGGKRGISILNRDEEILTMVPSIPAKPLPMDELIALQAKTLSVAAAAEVERRQLLAQYPPVRKTGELTKLGFKKTMGFESWKKRTFSLEAESLSYSGDGGASTIGFIPLAGVSVRIVTATTPARVSRFASGTTSASGSEMQGLVGKENCLELVVPMTIDRAGSATVSSERAYYMYCTSGEEAAEWCEAIYNNIKAVSLSGCDDEDVQDADRGASSVEVCGHVEDDSGKSHIVLADHIHHSAKSLMWFKHFIGPELSDVEVAEGVHVFYNELDLYKISFK